MYRILPIIAFFSCAKVLFCQNSTIDSVLEIHGGIDYYVGFQLNDFKHDNAPIYVSHNQLAGASINLALVEITYKPKKNLRLQLSPGFGSFMISNYAAEKRNLRWIYESYFGFTTNTKKKEWIDFGVFSSPYTYEFAKSWEQTMFTRSLAPEFVPYYLLGIRYKKKINSNLTATLFLLNGWQHIEIQRKMPSLGTQLEYSNGKNYVSWTTYQGNEKNETQPDFGYRAFTELSWIYTTNKYKFLACGYAGIQHVLVKSKFWGQVNFAAQYQLKKQLFINGRLEHFVDPNNIQINRISNYGFNCSGLSLGIHAKVSDNLSFRLESKLLRDNLQAGYFMKKGQHIQILPLVYFGLQAKF